MTLKQLWDDISVHNAASSHEAEQQAEMMMCLRDDLAALNLRKSQRDSDLADIGNGGSRSNAWANFTWFLGCFAAFWAHRSPQCRSMLLRVSEAGIKDPIACMIGFCALLNLYKVFRSGVIPRLTLQRSSGADQVFFEDPWGSTSKVPFSVYQHLQVIILLNYTTMLANENCSSSMPFLGFISLDILCWETFLKIRISSLQVLVRPPL